ncbi:MAG: hypothetical protein EAX90_05625 [Candidatus Heimdallarchaeota archaeon]|nr:hypothetical protein [Candidatus Heimdallarchaeota archaeon]
MTQRKTYSVLIIDNFHFDPDEDYVVEGFPTVELAIEYARRIVRSSVEHHRKPDQTKEELSKLWHLFGENASVLGFKYRGSDELGFFIDNPAKPHEIDWKEIEVKAGIR